MLLRWSTKLKGIDPNPTITPHYPILFITSSLHNNGNQVAAECQGVKMTLTAKPQQRKHSDLGIYQNECKKMKEFNLVNLRIGRIRPQIR